MIEFSQEVMARHTPGGNNAFGKRSDSEALLQAYHQTYLLPGLS